MTKMITIVPNGSAAVDYRRQQGEHTTIRGQPGYTTTTIRLQRRFVVCSAPRVRNAATGVHELLCSSRMILQNEHVQKCVHGAFEHGSILL